MKRNLILFFLLSIVFSCGNDVKVGYGNSSDTLTNKIEVSSSLIETGKVISGVKCSSDNRFSYSVYLPKSYNEKNNLSAVIFFDPHAKSELPLNKYKDLSEKYGLILISSSESKNGLPPGIYPEIYKAIKKDVLSKYHANPKRVYCAGFSGGARVAINIGLSDKEISGVIANSAGFEPSRSPINSDFVFVGIAGNEDFNLLEQRRTEASLSILPVSHLLIEFNGKHEWAPLEEMERAFAFLEISNKTKTLNYKTDSLIKIYLNEQIIEYKNVTNNLSRYQVLKKLLSLLVNHDSYLTLKNELIELERSIEVKMHQKEMEEIGKREALLQGDYFQKVFSESVEWWDKEIKNLNSEIKGKEHYLMNQRLKSYLSLAIYMTISSSEAKQDMFLMEKLIELYSLIDPLNSEWAYQKAVLRARQGNINETEQLLLKSLDLGFTERDRFLSQQEFVQLYNNQNILGRLK